MRKLHKQMLLRMMSDLLWLAIIFTIVLSIFSMASECKAGDEEYRLVYLQYRADIDNNPTDRGCEQALDRMLKNMSGLYEEELLDQRAVWIDIQNGAERD